VQPVLVQVDETSTVGDVLAAACRRRQLNVVEHYLRLKLNSDDKRNIQQDAAVTAPDNRSRLFTQVIRGINYSVVVKYEFVSLTLSA